MKRTQVRSKELSALIPYDFPLSKKDLCELVEDGIKIILVNRKPLFFFYQEKVLPTLQLLQEQPLLKKITVDMGAVKFVINGADIMRPGITAIDDGMVKDNPVVVVDEKNHKPLAVGLALLSTAEMKVQTAGKSVKNIHYIGDSIWRFSV